MSQRILLAGFLVLLLASMGFAQGHGIGLGAMIGTPTGITCKAWVEPSSAIQINVGYYSLDQTGTTALTADYIWHSHVFRTHQQLPLFYGLGGIVGFSGANMFGARLVGGIAWWPRGSSIDVFFQIAPTVYFKPTSDFKIDPGFGIRFFF